MTNHPSRAGAISAELFSEFLHELETNPCSDDSITRNFLRHRLMEAALAIAIRRASRKFNWAPNYSPSLAIDLAGYVHQLDVPVLSEAQATQLNWLYTEVHKIGKHAFIHLGL